MENLIKEFEQSNTIQMRRPIKIKKLMKLVSNFRRSKSIPTALQKQTRKIEQIIAHKLKLHAKQHPNSMDLSFFHYAFRKMNFKAIQNTSATKDLGNQVKFIEVEEFNQLYYMNPKCVGCSEIFIKQLPLHFNNQPSSIPYTVINQDQADIQNIRKAICSILNEGGGFLILTVNSTKRSNQRYLTQGFKGDRKFARYQISKLMQKCVETIFPTQQRERLRIDFVQLIQSSQSMLDKAKHNQFVVRVAILAKNKRYKRLFYIKNQLKNFTPSFQLYKMKRDQENYGELFPVKLLKNQIYEQMINTFLKQNKVKMKYKCFHPSQKNQQSDIMMPENAQFLNAKLPKYFEKPKQKKNFVFSAIQKDFFRSICKILYENNNYFREGFRKILQIESCVIFQFNEKINSIEHIQKVQNIFHASKINYQRLDPFPEFQKSLADFRKKEKSITINYYMVCYIFESKFVNFLESVKNKFGQHFSQQFMLHFVNKQIKLGCSMNQNQIKDFNFLIKHTFKIQPPNINKIELATFESSKSFKNITITFREEEINASLYSFLIFLITSKRPKCIP